MTALRLAAHTEHPTALCHRSAVLAVGLAQRAAVDAHEAVLNCPLGDTDLMLQRAAAWHQAELEVARCLLREQTLRAQAQGRAWLREVVNG